MIPLGYMLKAVVRRPDWIEAPSVIDVYSVSGCVSHTFADYINFWKHNGFWFFDTPTVLSALADSEKIDVSNTTLFYYEAYELEYDDETKQWSTFAPEPTFITNVVKPPTKRLQGYDVVTFSLHTSAECSPLSCNMLATKISVNEHCLFRTFDEAKCSLEQGDFSDSEPGPFRIIAVYKVDENQESKP